MTASAIGQIAAEGTFGYLAAAIVPPGAALGRHARGHGDFPARFLANFLLHPLIFGFITASGLRNPTSPPWPLPSSSRSAEASNSVSSGVLLSLLLQLYQTSRPHTAIVGQVPGTEHYCNVERHAVLTDPEILSIRVDESLYFANTRFLEDTIATEVAERPDLKHFILMCSAVNVIDAAALESLEEINRRLTNAGITFNLSGVKGAGMNRLESTAFIGHLNGGVFLSQHEAVLAMGRN